MPDVRQIVQSSQSGSPMVQDSSHDAISNLANDLNLKLDSSTKDYLMQYYLGEKSSQAAFQRELDASSTQYQRAVADLRKAGLNPFLAIQSLSGSGASSSGQSISGGLYTSRQNSSRETTQRGVQSILSVLGIIAAAVIYAMV